MTGGPRPRMSAFHPKRSIRERSAANPFRRLNGVWRAGSNSIWTEISGAHGTHECKDGFASNLRVTPRRALGMESE
jgi:hypothetical protein